MCKHAKKLKQVDPNKHTHAFPKKNNTIEMQKIFSKLKNIQEYDHICKNMHTYS
jgi:hypothetical protein